jgi:type IV secretion system protein VirB11
VQSPLKGPRVEEEIRRAAQSIPEEHEGLPLLRSGQRPGPPRVPSPTRAPGKVHAPSTPSPNVNRAAESIETTAQEATRRLLKKLFRELGPIKDLLSDPLVSDIHRNPDGKLWLTKIGDETRTIEYAMDDAQTMALIGSVSLYMRMPVTVAHPILEGTLPHDQSRFSAIIPPVANGGPMFSIRKRAVLQRSFDDYIDDGSMTEAQAAFIRKRLYQHDNVLVVGSTGSGKTTFCNAMLREISFMASTTERFMILEDTAELQCYAPQTVPLLTSVDVDMNALLKSIMRHNPTRICVGELRGAEAYTLIKAWNTGHDGGLTTIHSSSPANALTRLEDLIREAGIQPSRRDIASVVNLIVVIERDRKTRKRRVKDVVRLTGANGDNYAFSTI